MVEHTDLVCSVQYMSRFVQYLSSFDLHEGTKKKKQKNCVSPEIFVQDRIITVSCSCTAQHSTAQHSTAQHSTAQHSTAQHSTAQHSTAQHSTAQHSTAQHSTAQHSTAQHIPMFVILIFELSQTNNHGLI